MAGLNPNQIPPEILAAQEILAQGALAQEALAQEAFAQANASLLTSALPLLLPLLQAQNAMNSPFDLAMLNPPPPLHPPPQSVSQEQQNKKRKTFDSRDLSIPMPNIPEPDFTIQNPKPKSTLQSNNHPNKPPANPQSLNRPKPKQQIRKEPNLNRSLDFNPANPNDLMSQQFLQTLSNSLAPNPARQQDINCDDYEASNEYKWHQMRIKQEEESLKEQLNALNLTRFTPNVSPGTPTNPSINKVPKPTNPNMPKPQMNKTPQSTPNQLNQKPKKPVVTPKPTNDMDTIFTPTINNTSFSTPNQPIKKQKVQQTLNTPLNAEPIDLSLTPIEKTVSNLKSSVSPVEKAQMHQGAKAQGSNQNSMKIIGQVVQVTDVVSTQYWVCPTCGKSDESTPMIGCDSCDDWYHW